MRVRLNDRAMNDLMRDGLLEVIRRAKQAHYTNICVRIDGQDEWHEADWIKHLVARETEIERRWRKFRKAVWFWWNVQPAAKRWSPLYRTPKPMPCGRQAPNENLQPDVSPKRTGGSDE